MIAIRLIDEAHKADIHIKNDAFTLWGRMIPEYRDEKWSYTFTKNDNPSEMCFPDEDYTYSSDTVYLGAYDGEFCIGLAILKKGFFKYMYVEDLKVCRDHRRKGIGKLLICAALEYAKQHHSRGLYLVGQDNNLSACLFYISAGFRIGGLDTEVYKGTNQEGKADIIFYLDA